MQSAEAKYVKALKRILCINVWFICHFAWNIFQFQALLHLPLIPQSHFIMFFEKLHFSSTTWLHPTCISLCFIGNLNSIISIYFHFKMFHNKASDVILMNECPRELIFLAGNISSIIYNWYQWTICTPNTLQSWFVTINNIKTVFCHVHNSSFAVSVI